MWDGGGAMRWRWTLKGRCGRKYKCRRVTPTWRPPFLLPFYLLPVHDSVARQTEHLKTKVLLVEGDGCLDIAGVENEPVQCQRHPGFLVFRCPSVHAPPVSVLARRR